MAVDGSKPSIDASVQAIDIAKRYDAELIVLYVISPDTRYNYLEDVITPGLPRAMKDVMMIAMQKGAKHVDKVNPRYPQEK